MSEDIVELLVNDEVVAKYKIINDVLYLHICKDDFIKEIAIMTISYLEGKNFTHAAYLNIHAK